MRIAVVGCGAVGSFYGAKLCRSGHEVHFLLRSDYPVVRDRGVLIRSYQGDFHVRPFCAQRPEEIGVVDWVLVGLKTTANDQFPRLLKPLVSPRTAVLTLQNGLGNEERLAEFVPPRQIMGGLCFVCLNRLEPGVIHHLDHGRVVLGEYQRLPEERTHRLAALFRDAGVDCAVTENLARTHWEKLVWNIPFNGLGVAGAAGLDAVRTGIVPPGARLGPCLPTDRLLADPDWAGLLRALMLEVIATARALGFDVPDSLADVMMERTRSMGAYRASTLLDFERTGPLELESLFLRPLEEAQRANVPAPCLARLCQVLRQLDARRSEPR